MPCLFRFALLLVALGSCAPVVAVPPPPNLAREEITGLVYRPDGKVLYSAARNGLCAHDGRTGQILDCSPEPKQGPIEALAISPDGKLLATAHGSTRDTIDNQVRLWDANRLTVTRTVGKHGDLAAAVAFSPDGILLASGGYDGVIRLWDVATGKEVKSITVGNRVTGLAWGPDGKTLAAAGAWPNQAIPNLGVADSNFITLWDPQTGQLKKKLPIRGINVAFSADGRLIVAGGPTVLPIKPGERPQVIVNQTALRVANNIVLFDLRANMVVTEIEGQGNALVSSRDGRFVATARGTERHTTALPGVRIGINDMTRVATVRERWTGEPLTRERPALNGSFTVLALSPGMHLAAGDTNGTVRVVEVVLARNTDVLGDKERLWQDLGGDAEKAYPLALALAADSDKGIPLLREHLRPKPRDPEQVRKWIADLDDDEFAVRDAASRALAQLGSAAETELRQAESGKLSVEARHRLDVLLAPLNQAALPPDQLRAVRAVLGLEKAGTPEACAILETLVREGDPVVAREAQAALKRLGH